MSYRLKELNLSNTGMVYKFVKKGDVFIHTMCEGELLYRLGFEPKDIIGKTLYDFYPSSYADQKNQYYEVAWEGEYVKYESEVNGVFQVGSLRPVVENGEVIEVIGSCVDVTDRIQLQKEVHTKDHLFADALKTMSDAISHFEKEGYSRAIDFIADPGERTKLHTALQRTSFLIQEYMNRTRPTFQKEIMIRQQTALFFISLNDIIFIERMDRKSVIHTLKGQYETNDSLANLERSLDFRFMSCHRSYIINIEQLESIKPSGNSCLGYFKNYNKPAKIAKNKLMEIQQLKSH